MTMLYDAVMAFLAAAGLAAILWLLAGLVLRSRKEDQAEAVILLPARGTGERLEHDVRTVEAMARQLGKCTPVLVVDCGLDRSGRLRAAILESAHDCVAVVDREDVAAHIV